MSEINGNKTHWKKSGVDLLPALRVFIDELRGITCRRVARGVDVMLADCGEAVIRSQKNIRVRGELGIAVDVVQDLLQVIVGISERGFGGRPVDPRDEFVQAVALKMLRSVGIARPVKQREWLPTFNEHRQDHFGRGVGKISLLYVIRLLSPRGRIVSRGL